MMRVSKRLVRPRSTKSVRVCERVLGKSSQARIQHIRDLGYHLRPLMCEPENTLTLDATGLVCPEPLMLVRNRVREMCSGQVLEVRATDPSTGRDFTNFCRFMGHDLLDQSMEGDTYLFRIRKG